MILEQMYILQYLVSLIFEGGRQELSPLQKKSLSKDYSLLLDISWSIPSPIYCDVGDLTCGKYNNDVLFFIYEIM